MPKLSIFVFCEKVIIDDAGIASLIGLFNEVKVSPPALPLPPSAIGPKEWAVFVSWLFENGDDGKEFVQVLKILTPSETVFTEINTSFVMQRDRNQQLKMPLVGVPVGTPGNCSVWLSLKHQGNIVFEPPPILLKISHLPATSKPS